MPDVDPVRSDRELVLVGGIEPIVVVIAEYNPAWAERFALERERIAGAFGSNAVAIEHIGSTAVPSLGAKPVIDIQLSTKAFESEAWYVARLQPIGYHLRVREPDHFMFRTLEQDVHLHIWQPDSDNERRHLIFRDWLRAHPDDRALYEQTKRRLAEQVWEDRNDYADAKTALIAEIMRRASAAP